MEGESKFVGIDVSKAQLDVAVRPAGKRWTLPYDETGIEGLIPQIVDLEPTLCQRQLNSEHFRQFKIDTLSVDGNSGIVKLTHLPLIAQRFYQWSGLQELFPASREGAVGMGTSHHHPKFPFYRVILGSHFSPPILRPGCAWVPMQPLRRPPPDSLEGLSALWSSQFGPESLVGLRGVPRGDGKYSGVLITPFVAVSGAGYRKIPSRRGDGESPKSGRPFIPPVLIGRLDPSGFPHFSRYPSRWRHARWSPSLRPLLRQRPPAT